ncbi:hypothetical protein [Mycolicibacterium monacense]|uniref:hypothetical protein n=1 Tax=Mycolicibacterium monacense TaxID=85693 RepID=UPI0007EBE2DF|nr:hypothetical protein [Mycolicibacterium monacense]OBF48770.1 hypothetical protein A5778_22365 [Mycolicibacterium monacense]
MPTDHRRHAITETDDISRALDDARRAWPELADRPGALLRQLILVGQKMLAHNEIEMRRARQEAIDETGGALTGVFGASHLHKLREDWPE